VSEELNRLSEYLIQNWPEEITEDKPVDSVINLLEEFKMIKNCPVIQDENIGDIKEIVSREMERRMI